MSDELSRLRDEQIRQADLVARSERHNPDNLSIERERAKLLKLSRQLGKMEAGNLRRR